MKTEFPEWSTPCCIYLQQGVLYVQVFQVLWNGQAAGTAQVTQQGLYYHIECRCRLPDKGIYRVKLVSTEGITDLGICVPSAADSYLLTRIPVKKAGQGSIAFHLEKEGSDERFIPVKEDTPFAYIGSLLLARLRIRDRQMGVILQEAQGSNSQDSDPSPKHSGGSAHS